jgi:hypothetical protein
MKLEEDSSLHFVPLRMTVILSEAKNLTILDFQYLSLISFQGHLWRSFRTASISERVTPLALKSISR